MMKRERLRRWYDARSLAIQLVALALLLVAVSLIPTVVVVVGSGEAAVLWRRFGYFGLVEAGTVTDRVYGEGVQLKMPWDQLYVYNVRLQDATEEFDVLAQNGLSMKVTVTVRYRPLEAELGFLHKFAGPTYREMLIVPEVGAHARKQMALVKPSELYTSRREEVERAIYRNLVQEFDVRFEPTASLYGDAAFLRRQIIRVVSEAKAPVSRADIARNLNVTPDALLEGDLEALLADLLLETVQVEGQVFYRLHAETAADRQSIEEILGEGKPLVYVEDVLIRRVQLPEQVEHAIMNKLVVEQQTEEYEFRLRREEREKERKRIEAEGIRMFQDIVNEGISDRYLKWKGIDATLELAKSANAKVVIVGSSADGLPIILGPMETAPTPATGGRGGGEPPKPEPMPPMADNTPVGRRGTAAGAAGTPIGVPAEPPLLPYSQVPVTGGRSGGPGPATSSSTRRGGGGG